MPPHNEEGLETWQVHFLWYLLDGKREISEDEAEIRRDCLGLDSLLLPCVVVCILPYYSGVDFRRKDSLIRDCSGYVSKYLEREGLCHYCLTDTYDNFRVILPTTSNRLSVKNLDDFFIRFRRKFTRHFGIEIFVGIGSEASSFAGISSSSQEAMDMLAYKYQYSDRGVISIINTLKFKHYSLFGEDIMFARVIGCFQDGNLGKMSSRLDELVESVRRRPGVLGTAIKRTIIELAVNILHIASNAGIDADAFLDRPNFYSWVLAQNHTEILTEWLMNLSAGLLEQIEARHVGQEKQIISQACAYISENLCDPDLCLQAVSDNVGLSRSYFSQMFKAEKGTGLTSYINSERISRACELLRSTEMNAQDIAIQLGFSSASYFGQVFRKFTGTTPSSYRSKHVS